jgi:hypothetical protein
MARGKGMSSFDPLAAAIDWLDAYRAASLLIIEMYADDGAVECDCGKGATVSGRKAIARYWRKRFAESPAGELVDLQAWGEEVVLSFEVPKTTVQAALSFDVSGKIIRSRCGHATADLVFMRE